MAEVKKMPYSLYTKLFRLRCLSRSGSRELTSEEHKFCREMLEQYEELYSLTESRVFNATVPFGSSVHQEEKPIDEYIDYGK